MAAPLPTPTPSEEELSELILCARYGEEEDLNDIKAFVDKYGAKWLSEARDDRGNTCLHMAGGNGHQQVVDYLLPLLPASALTTPNTALSTPLHWISLNYHLSILRSLCPLLPRTAFDIPNAKGKTAVQEAEEACESYGVPEGGEQSERGRERVRREVVVGYLLGCMGLGVSTTTTKKGGADKEGEEGEKEEEEEEVVSAKAAAPSEGAVPKLEQGVNEIKLDA